MDMRVKVNQIGHGKLKLPLKPGKFYTIWGGPYRAKPETMDGIKLAMEIKPNGRQPVVDLPIADFQVPSHYTLDTALYQAVERIISGQPLYAGCMGGQGRTGLFLAILAKAFGVADPVKYVRQNYYPHAVETKQQYRFVEDYPIPSEVRSLIDSAASLWNWRTWFKSDLTVQPRLPAGEEQ